MCMRHIATVQHHASAVYIINVLHALLYPTMTSSLLQVLPFHSPFYNTLYAGVQLDLHDGKDKLGAAGGERSEPPLLVACMQVYYSQIYTIGDINWVQQGASEASPPACIIESVDSISRDGPDTPIYVIHCKKPNNSAQILFHIF